MNRFLTCTAVGLFLGLTPALAEPQLPADDAQTPPAVNEPSQIPEAMPADPSASSDPAAPIPGDSSQASPELSPTQPGDVSPPPQSSEAQPGDEASPPAQSSEAQPGDEASPPAQSSEAPKVDEASPPAQSSEAPQPIEPAAPKSAEASGSGQFLMKQASDDWLATNLIGQPVYNAQDEVVGDINDLVTDQNGKVVAALIGSGGFLGLGEKDVALRFEDLRLTRDDSNTIKIIADLNQETLAAAPDYETLADQTVTVGSTKGDREDAGGGAGGEKTY